jgi:tetratricopeptide (TPR) repeat protein
MIKRTILFFSAGIILFSCGDATKDESVVAVEEQQIAEENQTELAFKEKLAAANQAIKANLNNANLYADRAELFLEVSDLPSASADLKRALSLDSNSYRVYIVLGDLQAAQGQFEPTKYAFEMAYKNAKTKDERANAYLKIGEIFYVIQDYDKAIDFADKALREDQYNANIYYLKGLVFDAQGNAERALSSWQTAVEQDPQNVKSYLQLALAYGEMNDPLVIDYTNNVLSIDSTNIDALYTQAMYQQEHDMLNEAMENYTTISRINPRMREAPYNMGYIHLVHLKLYAEAKKYFEKAIKIDPNYHEAYYNYGYCFELLGDIQNAETIYKKALEIKPDYTAAAKGMSRVTDFRTINE